MQHNTQPCFFNTDNITLISMLGQKLKTAEQKDNNEPNINNCVRLTQ